MEELLLSMNELFYCIPEDLKVALKELDKEILFLGKGNKLLLFGEKIKVL